MMQKPFLYRFLFVSIFFGMPVVSAAKSDCQSSEAVSMHSSILNNGDQADIYAPRSHCSKSTYPVVVVLQGALVDKSDYSEFSRRLAAKGYVVVVPNHEQTVTDFTGAESTGFYTEVGVITHSLDEVQLENEDPTSPLYRIVNTDRMAVVGHSFGGAVAIIAAGGACLSPVVCNDGKFDRPAALKAAVVYGGSWLMDLDTTGVPVALLQGDKDGVAAPIKAEQTLPLLETPHALISIGGANHYAICNENNPARDLNPSELDQDAGLDQIVGWTNQWLKANLSSDSSVTE